MLRVCYTVCMTQYFKVMGPPENKKMKKLKVLSYIAKLQNFFNFSNVNCFGLVLVLSWPYSLNVARSKMLLKY